MHAIFIYSLLVIIYLSGASCTNAKDKNAQKSTFVNKETNVVDSPSSTNITSSDSGLKDTPYEETRQTQKLRPQVISKKQALDTVIVNDGKYFHTHFNNNADVYVINKQLSFKSNTKVVFKKGTTFIIGPDYPTDKDNRYSIFKIYNVRNFSISGGKINAPGIEAVVVVAGNSSNVNVSNFDISNSKTFGALIYGRGAPVKPKEITFKNINTTNCAVSGIYVNSASNINISYCNNSGGWRHIGIESPMPKLSSTTLTDDQRYSHDIEISHCTSKKTRGFGIQLYYTNNAIVRDCNVEGSDLIKGDISCYTVDRANNVTLLNDTSYNSKKSNILIAGSYNVTVKNNYSKSPLTSEALLTAFYNIEIQEDKVIAENKNLTFTNNYLEGSANSIIINGVEGINIINNKFVNNKSKDILILNQVRSRDSKKMYSKKINIIGKSPKEKIRYDKELNTEVKISN